MSISGNWDRRVSRRAFLGMGGMSAAALVLGSREAMAKKGSTAGFGELVADPGGLIDLPKGFQYRVISAKGSPLSSGGTVPGDPDGMAAFAGPKKGTALLVRNHELKPEDGSPVVGRNPYDPSQTGGTTGILVNLEDRTEIKDFVTSSGTRNNCAGGATPWGTWLTCEEDRTTGHGYVFEVDPRDPENDLSKTPIRAMGFFSHEAVDIDPATGIAYLTEDDFRGAVTPDPNQEVVADYSTSEIDPSTGQRGTGTRVSFLYRYIPDDRSQKPGALQMGGRLQALALEEKPNYNVDLASPGQKFGVVWKDVNPEEPHESAEDAGAARFGRLEGAYFAGGAFWFDDTIGGEKRLGQVFRYLPATETLELFYEGTEPGKMESPDNIVVTPWGDLWFAEDEAVDGDSVNRVMGITPEGQVYVFARNATSDSEFAGPTFSPDGKTFFVNMQGDGLTFAIWGPFGRHNSGRQRQMAVAAPPKSMAPKVSGELAEAADKFGMSHLEAAAYERLGVSLA
ncbi:MAG TPA: alkaline phosphatase PhoX [Rubrobacteraceae bacterium]|nr:alkaline phosphatase PhoX [Rubrobacteraceae bacterium]